MSVDRDYASSSLFQEQILLTILRSHLDTSCYFWYNLIDVDVKYNYIYLVKL